MKYFFWIAFAVFLAASIPHVAYFFASFEPSQGPEGIWWWAVSYAIAISIDVTVYLLSWTAFRRYRKYRTPRAVWQHWLLIVICTVFSWGVNWAYAKQFHSPVMLSSAESTAPWLTSVFPFMASAFPLLGIVYTMMAETITEASVEDHLEKEQHLTALGELAKQTQLPIATLQRALTAGSARLNASTLLTTLNQRSPSTVTAPETTGLEKSERPITGKFVTIEGDATNVERSGKQSSNPALVSVSNDVNPDKLQMTIEALKARPDMADEALAEFLSLKRPASARFWRLKAIEILNAPDKGTSDVAPRSPWTGSMANGVSAAR
jgi:DNA-binding transcriptional regulator YhcF (GntR family)